MDENQKIVDALNKRMEDKEYKPFLKKQSWLQLIAIAVSVLGLSIILTLTGVMDLETQSLPNILIIGGSLSLIVILFIAAVDLLRFLKNEYLTKR